MEGLLLVDKPAGLTSHDVVDRVRRLAGIRAVGHAGTLDPFATGLLILGLGKATKWLNQLQGLDKSYEATAMLGATSDTYDKEGKITSVVPAQAGTQSEGMDSSLRWNDKVDKEIKIPTQKDIERVSDLFRGGYEQKAPLHSAKKIQGKKLYELARAGKADESMRPTKAVTIARLEIVRYAWPELVFSVDVSSGTYIRSLADDIGHALGVGAYLTELRRTRIGPYRIEQAHTLPSLTPETLENALVHTLDIGAVG